MSVMNFKEIYQLFEELCTNLAGKNSNKALKCISQYISTHPNTLSNNLPYDETTLVQKISSQLSISKSPNDVSLFSSCYEQLSTCMDAQYRNSILTFLLCMADVANNKANTNKNIGARTAGTLSTLNLNNQFTSTTFFNRNFLSSTTNENVPTVGQRVIPTSSSSTNINSKQKPMPFLQKSKSVGNFQSALNRSDRHLSIHAPSTQTIENDADDDLVQNVIYAFTGIEGKYLKNDVIVGGLKLDPKLRLLNVKHSAMLLRLGEIAYYHDQVESFTDASSGRSPLGLLGQGLVTALKRELTLYYGMVAMLQEQLNRHRMLTHKSSPSNSHGNAIANGEKMTLSKIELWIREPSIRLQWLAKIAEACQEKKGGALATEIFCFKHNGNSNIKSLVHDLLVAVCAPLQYMLGKWLVEGEINDPHSEFFIEVLPEVGTDRLWNDKYRVRESMLPCFITKELAYKILVTGKSINFLKDICEERTLIKGKKDLKEYLETNVDNIFADVPDTKLHMMINDVYLNTSKKVLDIVMGPHKLLEHLQAMRKYLLLGQGDFIGLLMENLKPELDRPAKDLYSYELSSILDAALRATNSQYDDPEILNYLDVRLMSNFEGDTGWDIFSLQYTVRGPLSTMLEPSMAKYLQLFKHLWRMKHLEFVLSAKIWKDQICNAKILRSMKKELNPVLYRLYLYTSEMIHFIHQIQYYILFEVVECSWTKLLEKVQKATALDDILEAHNEFLRNVKIGAFLEDNGLIHGSLEAVFNASIKLETWQDRFYEVCLDELNARRQMANQIKLSAKDGTYGITAESRFERDQNQKIFEMTIAESKKTLEKIGTDYEYAVRQFLLLLATHNDQDMLQFGIRLDFNEYYKNRDQRLCAPLTFEHQRMTMGSMLIQNRNSNVMISSVGAIGATGVPSGSGASKFLTTSSYN